MSSYAIMSLCSCTYLREYCIGVQKELEHSTATQVLIICASCQDIIN